MPSAADALATLASQLRSEDTVVSPHVADPTEPGALGELVAAGAQTAQDPAAFALVIEAVREGYLLHYGEPRLITGADSDLRLLAGDYLYALGLERLAGLGNLAAVRELSDLISLGAQLHADGPGDGAGRAAVWLWLAATLTIATGEYERLAEAKFALSRGNPGAEAAMEEAAVSIASAAGLAEPLARASHAIQFRAS